jgi:DNA-binding NtrC family response regulator
MAGERVLIVDDEDGLRWVLKERLAAFGFALEDASTGAEAMRIIRTRPRFDAVLLDYKLPDRCGIDLLREIKAVAPGTVVIVMTAFSSVEAAVQAMKCGAADYATKPLDLDAVVRLLRDACKLDGSATPAPSSQVRGGETPDFVGDSETTRRVRAVIERVATSPVPTVLLTGESGTGKDLVARVLHGASPRSRRAFVHITCSALPETLLESELFGHEAGAFTPLTREKKGLLELADGGTVYFDEVAEMTPSLQSKLLRFIEERAFRRVGGTEDVRVDVRVVAATNRDLQEEVAVGRFREDLYYRLRVVPIHLPPLRERKDDIGALSSHFITEFNRFFGKSIRGLSPDCLGVLTRHSWPGNVRELKHTLERAMLLADGEFLTAAECGPGARDSGEHAFRLPPEGLVLAQLERSLVKQALDATGWNQVRAGRLLGLNRDQVRYRIEKFGLAPDHGVDGGRAA